MSLPGYVILLTAALCTAAPAPDGSCPKPPRRDGEALTEDWENDSYPPGKTATYQCRPGYSRVGRIVMICAEGEWQFLGRKGECRRKSCGHPGDIPFGSFQLTEGDSFVFGAIVEYSCEDGYQMVSREKTRLCTANGWSNYLPHCEVRNCPPVDAADNVNVLSTSYDDEYSVGQVVRFECKDPNLKLDGASEIFCTSEGRWNLEPPKCIEISCRLPTIENGEVNNPRRQVYKNNDAIQITCNIGFKPSTSRDIKCTKDGWNPTPSCDEIFCSAYSPVLNGKLIATKPSYKYEEEIDVKCDDGYKLQQSIPKCTANGWSPPPVCVSKNCDKPDINHGSMYYNYYFPRNLRSSIYYRCEENYLSHERQYYGTITCTNTGWDPEPTCSRQCLKYKAKVENAKLKNEQYIYLEGEKVKFECKDNYQTPDGKVDGERTCLPNGEFTPAKCSKTCKAPKLPDGKFRPIKNEFEIGESLQYECNKGFMTEDRKLSRSAWCRDQGWSEEPRCIPITCTYGGISYNDGDIIKYTCRPGQRPQSESAQCYYIGFYPPLRCLEEKPEATVSPTNVTKKQEEKPEATVSPTNVTKKQEIKCIISENANLIRNPSKVHYKENNKVLLDCERDFRKKGVNETTCTANGWDPPLPTCVPLSDAELVTSPPDSKDATEREKCPLPYKPTSAEIKDPKEEYYNNDNVTMTCVKGYKMNGSPVIRCIEGKWEQPPQCIQLTPCRSAPKINNGDIAKSSIKKTYVTDNIVTFSCNPGYHLTGPEETTCVEGQWTALPACTENPCDRPPEVLHATVVEEKDSFNHGESAKYKCENGFRFSGSDSASCIKGRWTTTPTCVATSCSSPPEVKNSRINGKIEDTYASGEKVTYVCKAGFSLERSSTGEALCENTRWKNVPVCRKIGAQCGPPPVVQYGDTISFNKPVYRSGEYVEYKCPEYYILQGNSIVRCLNGVWDEAPDCLEPCTAKTKDMEDNKIKLRFKDAKKLYSTHGDTMEFICLPGYEAAPGTQMRRTCEHGKLQYPKCFKTGFCVLDQSKMITHNIHYNASTIVDDGETVTFQCHEEMIPGDKLEAKCESGRINYPTCSATRSCETPTILNGFLKTEPKASYDSGSYVEFECNKDYVISIPTNAKCENGQWTELPVCHSPCKISPEDLNKRNIQLLPSDDPENNSDITHRHGTQLSVTCKSGFRRPYQTTLEIDCYNGKSRYTRCFAGKTCRVDQDKVDENNLELDDVHDNEVFYEENEEVRFKCKTGYHSRNKLTATCSKEKLNYPSCTAQSSG